MNNDKKRFRIDCEYNNNNDDENQNPNEILLKRKAKHNNNNNNDNNTDYNNSDSNNNSCNKVFNNIYIRRIIFNHLNRFNILYPIYIIFKSVKEFQQFKYKEYLHRVALHFEDDQFELNKLPMNIKYLAISSPNLKKYGSYEIIQVPDHIESLKYTFPVEAKYINSLSHSSKLKTLYIDSLEEEILPNQIPNSVTNLEISTSRLLNNVLPSNLKNLFIEDLESFEDKCLQIESLIHLRIEYSTPLILDQLSRSFFKNLVKLELRNITKIDSNIQFPDNLKELLISCNTFNYLSSNKLESQQPSTDKYHQIQFPPSLEKLSIFTYHNPKIDSNIQFLDNLKELSILCNTFNNFESLPPNLKSLEISLTSIVDDKGQSILPNKLEMLVISGEFDQVLQVNQLPSTLTHLDLRKSSFNQVIDFKVLPVNLDTLILGSGYSQIINPLAIPQQLKLLQILNYDYSHPINLTPSTHPNTAISLRGDINLYYQATSSAYNQIRVLRLPYQFDSPFSTLQLQNKSNLEYLHLGYFFNHPIELSDLPTQNNIKTIEISRYSHFKQTINLEHFQNLETLILHEYSNPTIITSTTIIDEHQQQHHLHYNNYKLKNIMVSQNNFEFLKQLDTNFYPFIKYNNKLE